MKIINHPKIKRVPSACTVGTYKSNPLCAGWVGTYLLRPTRVEESDSTKAAGEVVMSCISSLSLSQGDQRNPIRFLLEEHRELYVVHNEDDNCPMIHIQAREA